MIFKVIGLSSEISKDKLAPVFRSLKTKQNWGFTILEQKKLTQVFLLWNTLVHNSMEANIVTLNHAITEATNVLREYLTIIPKDRVFNTKKYADRADILAAMKNADSLLREVAASSVDMDKIREAILAKLNGQRTNI